MDDELVLTDRVALAGQPITVEDLYRVTPAGIAYLLEHDLAAAPVDVGAL